MKRVDNAIFMEPEDYEKFLEGHADPVGEPGVCGEPGINNDDAPKVSLYEMNQMLIAQMPAYDAEQMERADDIIYDWIYNGNKANYYMLLCKELSYYTVFHSEDNCLIANDFIAELWDVLRGMTIRDVSVDTNGVIAIWIDWDDGMPHCFYLFPYDKGVVEF